MASKHTAIIRKIMIDWTAERRGTLWHNPQLRVPMGDSIGWTRAGLGDGTADIVGIEYYDGAGMFTSHGIWISIEVKTRGDWLKKRQMDHISIVTDWDGHYYLGLEMPGCSVEYPKYKLFSIRSLGDAARVKREWNKIWADYEKEQKNA